MSIEVEGVRQQMPRPDSLQAQGAPNDVQRIAETRKADIEAAVRQIQQMADMFSRNLKFQVSDELKRVIVKVIDTSTDKVIREIPSQEIQRLHLQMQEAIGLLFDQSI